MKLTDFGIVFACVFLCVCLVWGINIVQLNTISQTNRKYNQAIDNAVTDGLHMFVELDSGENLQFNVEESKEQFFRTLGINLNVGLEVDRLEEYVPVLCYLLPEGFYIYHNNYSLDKDGNMVRTYERSDLYNYYMVDQYYEYCFTLSDEIWIRDKKTMEIYQGKPEEIAKYCNVDFLGNANEFDNMKNSVVVENVIDKLTYYANEYNLYGENIGAKYEFYVPQISDATWVRTIKNPGIIAFVQGLPYSGNLGCFNKVAFGGARLYKKG